MQKDDYFPTQAQHPSEPDLMAFAVGKLPPAQAETVTRHLESCTVCQERAAAAPADSFMGRLRGTGALSDTPSVQGAVTKGVPAGIPVELSDLPPELRDHAK